MAISATCPPRMARSIRTTISTCSGRSTPDRTSGINDIARALKGADKLILATDPDREGEAISWHVLEVLKEKKALKDHKIERVVFNAITKQAVTEAMKHPRADRRPHWSMPISPAARSIISSASRSRRCCGASCRAHARPAACNRSRCGLSATASSKSRNSSRKSTGRSSPSWRRRATRSSKRAWSAPTGRRSSASTSAPAPRRKHSPAISRTPSSR